MTAKAAAASWAAILIASCLIWASSSEQAYAHLVTTGLGPIYDGATHFVSSPEDIISVAGLAILAGLRGPRPSRWVLFVLPVSWAIGGLAALLIASSATEYLRATSLLVVGGVVATDYPLPIWVTVGIAALTALLNGYADAQDLPASWDGSLMLVGMAATAFLVFACLEALVLPLKSQIARVALRVSGSWIAASGILLLGWSLRGIVRFSG